MFTTLQTLSKNLFSKPAIADSLTLVGRILLALIFVTAGYSKLGAGYAGTAGYMASVGLPAFLLPFTILLEIGGGLAIMLGFQTRITAILLAGFTLATGFIFHGGSADQMQQIMFMKNLSIAGAFLLLAVNGGGALSIDRRFFGDKA